MKLSANLITGKKEFQIKVVFIQSNFILKFSKYEKKMILLKVFFFLFTMKIITQKIST